MRTLVIGDVHGARRALEQALERSRFDPAADRAIFLGDVVDGWSEPAEAIRLLTAIGAESVLGNHDAWFLDWLVTASPDGGWLEQRGPTTLRAFDSDVNAARSAGLEFVRGMKPFVHDEGADHLFVHGGIPRDLRDRRPPDLPPAEDLWWDRTLFQDAADVADGGVSEPLTRFRRVFIGHTPTSWAGLGSQPLISADVVGLDTGAGYDGRLTIMDAHTLEYWQSDPVPELYPEDPGPQG